MRKTPLILAAVLVPALALAAWAAANRVSTETRGDRRCILSNGIPDHPAGRFPNPGDPNRLHSQKIRFCVTRNPQKGSVPQPVATVGIARNGILIRPGTADWYDPRSPRGHSRDPSSGWNLEGVGSGRLGLDAENAHVDDRGLYHYHAMPDALKGPGSDTFVGYAADGFEIHYVGGAARPSWQLKRGTRPTAPGGRYDGTYNEDYVYVPGSGNLDRCNGAKVKGKYVYFATDAYPYFPRCLYGTELTRIGSGPGRGPADRRGPPPPPRP